MARTAEQRRMQSECWQCKHRRSIVGDCHISCIKPDPNMTGNPHGIRNGWFTYPLNFDPVWKTSLCRNFEKEEGSTDANH